jgi:hypothetical protein
MRITLTIFLLLLFSANMKAPEYPALIIAEGVRIDPYARLLYSVGMVESRNDDNAVNLLEQAYGRYQIRSIRLKDYYQRTGIRYTLAEMRDSVKSRKVIMYYIHSFGVYRQDKFILSWNCNSQKYLQKVKKLINQ